VWVWVGERRLAGLHGDARVAGEEEVGATGLARFVSEQEVALVPGGGVDRLAPLVLWRQRSEGQEAVVGNKGATRRGAKMAGERSARGAAQPG
jgi:hypothetical protein